MILGKVSMLGNPFCLSCKSSANVLLEEQLKRCRTPALVHASRCGDKTDLAKALGVKFCRSGCFDKCSPFIAPAKPYFIWYITNVYIKKAFKRLEKEDIKGLPELFQALSCWCNYLNMWSIVDFKVQMQEHKQINLLKSGSLIALLDSAEIH